MRDRVKERTRQKSELQRLRSVRTDRMLLMPCLSSCETYASHYFTPSLSFAPRCLQEEIKAVIKQLQGSTRILQHICAHAKVEKDQRVFKLGEFIRINS